MGDCSLPRSASQLGEATSATRALDTGTERPPAPAPVWHRSSTIAVDGTTARSTPHTCAHSAQRATTTMHSNAQCARCRTVGTTPGTGTERGVRRAACGVHSSGEKHVWYITADSFSRQPTGYNLRTDGLEEMRRWPMTVAVAVAFIITERVIHDHTVPCCSTGNSGTLQQLEFPAPPRPCLACRPRTPSQSTTT
jgi:hypothetical protein